MKLGSNFLLLIYVALVGISCSHTAPEEVTYVLPNPEGNDSLHGTATIEVAHVKLANYLDQGGFVMKSDDYKVLITHQHRWAEPLDQGIKRYLSRSLFAQTEASSSTVKISITFDAFESINFDDVVAQGHWTTHDSSNKVPFAIRVALNKRSYPGIVEGYTQLLDQLAAIIRTELEE